MSSLFPDFSEMFRVGKIISQSSNTDPEDVLKTKKALVQTGDYKVPDYGMSDIPDMGMIDGLKKFQKKNGLKVDGVMKPGGPTESKIGEALATKPPSDLIPMPIIEEPKPEPVKPDDPLITFPENPLPGKGDPWFRSPKLQPVSDEAHAENGRTVEGMLKSSQNGLLPKLYADAISKDGEKAVAEYANFLQQLSERKKDRVDGFEQEVTARLPKSAKQLLSGLDAGYISKQTSSGESGKADESIDEFCAALPDIIQKSRDDLQEYQEKYDAAVKKLEELPEEIERLENELRSALVAYAASIGKDALTLAWASLWAVVVSAVGAIDLRDKYTRINEMKNDKSAETDKRTYGRLIESEKANLKRLLQTQKDKCS